MSDSASDIQRPSTFAGFATPARPAREDLARPEAMRQRGAAGIERGTTQVVELAALRQLVDGVLHRAFRSGVSSAEVREAMCRACAMARKEGMQPEYLLVSLKRMWRELPEGRRMLRNEREATLSALITLCIEEYYAPMCVLGTRS